MIASRSSLKVEHLSAFYGAHQVFADVSLAFEPNAVTALMGPSGCGKTTLLRCLNRLHELTPGGRIEGRVLLDEQDAYASSISTIELRRRIGIVFQRPNPFPTLSILGNVTSGLNPQLSASTKRDIAERALSSASLWDEVRDKLDAPATALSGGQQQRLCIARALAVEPEVLLMDEPTSSLDPISTSSIEDLITGLSAQYPIIIVTHNMHQAARVSHFAAFMLGDDRGIGRLVEYSETSRMFRSANDPRTEDYITGRFG